MEEAEELTQRYKIHFPLSQRVSYDPNEGGLGAAWVQPGYVLVFDGSGKISFCGEAGKKTTDASLRELIGATKDEPPVNPQGTAQEVASHLSDLKMKKVILGEPGLLSQLSGKVVVATEWCFPFKTEKMLKEDDNYDAASRDREGKRQKDDLERHQAVNKNLMATAGKYVGDVVIFGLHGGPWELAEVQDKAALFKFDFPVVEIEDLPKSNFYDRVRVFDRNGEQVYFGTNRLGNVDEAIRLAMSRGANGRAVVASSTEAKPGLRTWTDIQGRQLQGTLLSFSGSKVNVLLANGQSVQLDLSKLSPADQAYVKAASNP